MNKFYEIKNKKNSNFKICDYDILLKIILIASIVTSTYTLSCSINFSQVGTVSKSVSYLELSGD